MVRFYLTCIIIVCLCSILDAHEIYTGKVYVDSNRNGVYDVGEKMLKDVMVSDGLNVVRTDNEGAYSLSGA